jgi:mannose-1-phosphate guanylyltransferase
MQIVIVAGGGGTRLWPLSTDQKPKQFVEVIQNKSLLRLTYDRLRLSFEPDQIWIATLPQYVDLVKEQIPFEFIPEHILSEPSKRDTFAAFTSHAAVIAGQTSWDEPLLFIQSDHVLGDRQSELIFNQTLVKVADQLKSKDNQFELIALAVKPNYPSTSYGYFELTKENLEQCFGKVVEVLNFKEKPNKETAEQFLHSGRFLWNVSPSCFNFNNLFKAVQVHQPEAAPILKQFSDTKKIDPDSFEKMVKNSFEYALVEKLNKVGVIGMDILWEDVGNWDVLQNYLPDLGRTGPQLQLAGENNKVKLSDPNRKVALVGVSNLVVVETEEGLLVIDPKYSPLVKDVSKILNE